VRGPVGRSDAVAVRSLHGGGACRRQLGARIVDFWRHLGAGRRV